MDRAADFRKDVIGIRTDESDRAHHDHQDHGQHDRIFRDILTLLVRPKLMKQACHGAPPPAHQRAMYNPGIASTGFAPIGKRPQITVYANMLTGSSQLANGSLVAGMWHQSGIYPLGNTFQGESLIHREKRQFEASGNP